MSRRALALSIVMVLTGACACGRGAATGGGTGTGGTGGTGTGTGSAGDCEAARAHVTDLYRTEAADKDPKVVEQSVADNTTMVMTECARDPRRVAACAAKAASAAALESKCLAPLDDEGTEGDQFKP